MVDKVSTKPPKEYANSYPKSIQPAPWKKKDLSPEGAKVRAGTSGYSKEKTEKELKRYNQMNEVTQTMPEYRNKHGGRRTK